MADLVQASEYVGKSSPWINWVKVLLNLRHGTDINTRVRTIHHLCGQLCVYTPERPARGDMARLIKKYPVAYPCPTRTIF